MEILTSQVKGWSVPQPLFSHISFDLLSSSKRHSQYWVIFKSEIHLPNWNRKSIMERERVHFFSPIFLQFIPKQISYATGIWKMLANFLRTVRNKLHPEKHYSTFLPAGGQALTIACAVDHHEMRFPILRKPKSIPREITGVRKKLYSESFKKQCWLSTFNFRLLGV